MQAAQRYLEIVERVCPTLEGTDIVRDCIKRNDNAQLERIMAPLTFGTAGLRGPMGPGFGSLNDLTIAMATKGVIQYLTEVDAEARKKGIVIGYDCRRNSQRFASIAAHIANRAGIPVKLFGRMVPTPYVAYGVLCLGCSAGIMVTASHNPRQDNGYKVYWGAGAQILSPIDVGIAKYMSAATPDAEDFAPKLDGVTDPFVTVHDSYISTLRTVVQVHPPPPPGLFTYTAMHGVGTPYTLAALSAVGVPTDSVVKVAEQCEPDGNFPTAPFPNPEEKNALALAMKTGTARGSRIILANDPDADRLAVAEVSADGKWKAFSGNEIGALLGWWAVHTAQQNSPSGRDWSKYALLSSAVSSKILKSIAQREGLYFEETLTGFKWMGTRTAQLQAENFKVLFAFEEAIGFMYGDRVRDKDGVTAAAALAQLASVQYAKGETLTSALEGVFKRYGRHVGYSSYVISPSPAITNKLFSQLPTVAKGKQPELLIADVKVVAIRDLITGVDTRQPSGAATLPNSTVSPMITYYFANGVELTIRGSGTEPKVKWYSEAVDTLTQNALADFVDRCLKVLFAPVRDSLRPARL